MKDVDFDDGVSKFNSIRVNFGTLEKRFNIWNILMVLSTPWVLFPFYVVISEL